MQSSLPEDLKKKKQTVSQIKLNWIERKKIINLFQPNLIIVGPVGLSRIIKLNFFKKN